MKTKPQSKTENDPLWSERRILDDLDVTASTLDRWRKDPVVRFPKPSKKVREDKQSIDVKYEKHWAGKLNTRFVIMTNELPRINDASGALASRFVVLTMRNSFLNKEDLRLTDTLLRELPGILNWALAGLERLQQRGHFVMPESSRQAIELLEDLASPVGAFIRDWCVVGPGETVGVRTLFDAYCKWCDREGHKASSDIAFGRSLRGIIAAINWQGRGRERKYVGIGLNEDE